MNTIPTDAVTRQIKALLKANAGKFFTVTFQKKDGTIRTLNCQHGHFKGHDGVNTVAHIEKYLTVHTAEGFKNVDCSKVKQIKMGGKVMTFS